MFTFVLGDGHGRRFFLLAPGTDSAAMNRAPVPIPHLLAGMNADFLKLQIST